MRGSIEIARKFKAGAGARRSRSVSWVVAVALVLILIAAMPIGSPAQQPADNGWIGKRVVQRYRGFQLQIDHQVIDPKAIKTYRVERVNGGWLWLQPENGGVSGWAGAGQVVPVDQAIAVFTDDIRANPGDPHGYIMRATIWRQDKKELDNALFDMDEAIRLAPTDAAAWQSRGLAWHAKKEYDKAIADDSEAIRLDPSVAITYSNRGDAWYHKKEYDKAIADYNEAIRLDPKFAWPYNNRGTARRATKEYDKAIADYNEAIRLDPNDALPYSNRAWLWARCPDVKYRDATKAVESAAKACELTRMKVPSLLDTLAMAHAEAGDFDAAVKWQTKAIALLADGKEKGDYRARLKRYQEKKPDRETKP